MSKPYRMLTVLAGLSLGACAAQPQQLAGPMDGIARAPREARASRSCAMPALDSPMLASLLMDATMGGAQVVATVYECQRRAALD